ncbi:MAG: polysaccharide deacetylase family protein [Verrucomicrobiaceae bacterium]|nr:polysaccharide deacetylase family protein [Verrucomicrobiaceae bacterium]
MPTLAFAANKSPLQARIAITLDLEMSRNFPRWEDTGWDYEKGNLNAETKRYAVEAASRVKERGGRVHCFVVGRALEQEDVQWLKDLHAQGHRIGNHTYDHVNVLARKPEDTQFRFLRSPWLVKGRNAEQVICENIQLCSEAMKTRLGFEPDGFRTPGGFRDGLVDREDIQAMLQKLGFRWVSSKYPRHLAGQPGKPASEAIFDSIVKAQSEAQPFKYSGGLVEIPMSPISDIGAFRAGRWPLDNFLQAIHRAVTWAIERGAVFDLLCHPSVMYPSDPDFRTIDLICDLVQQAGERARLVTLDELATEL